jgi:hypothetical protein
MTIYRKSTSFARRIYKKLYGKIPKDILGRSYDIHHIDGNHSNDDPTNLIAVSIQEHYDIHYAKCDWGACYTIALRIKKSAKLISELASKSNKERIANGTHNWQKRLDGSTFIGDAYKAGLRTQVGRSNSRFDNTTYTFIHNPTGNNVTMTQYDFVKSFNLNKGAVCSMIKNHKGHRTVKGWQVVRELD